MESNLLSGNRMEPLAPNDMIVKCQCRHNKIMSVTENMWIDDILVAHTDLCPGCIALKAQAHEAAKSLIRPFVLCPRKEMRYSLQQLQPPFTECGPKYHTSIGMSYFANGEDTHGKGAITNPELLHLPPGKIGVYRIGKVTCEEMFDLAEIYREVCDEEKEVIQVALFS